MVTNLMNHLASQTKISKIGRYTIYPSTNL